MNGDSASSEISRWRFADVAISSCPFCGNPPKVLCEDDFVTVECAGSCWLKKVSTGRYTTKAGAIEAWNTRASDGGENE